MGIARLAAQSELLEAKSRVEYFELETRRWIGRCSGSRMPFEWTINPYRGCEFGCQYCYARYTHEFMELHDGRDFERRIFAKRWNAAAFRADLGKIPRKDTIALGTATDPYQPAERRFRLTRRMLEVFAREQGRRLGITTKSDLVTRDAELLAAIARANFLTVNVTITTVDAALARLLEPYAPRPDLRLIAVEKLSRAGVPVGVFASPVLPLINDGEESLEAVARAAQTAGARYFGGNLLFLKPCAGRIFFPFLEAHFPHLVRRYRERFDASAFLRGAYPETISARLAAIRKRTGLARSAPDYRPELWQGEPQLELPWR